jgi:hypothetical protein
MKKTPRKIIVHIVTSADGYIARPNGDFSWLNRPRPRSTARETCRAMRAKGKSPTSAIAPPAFIENHAVGQSPSRISMKLRGCQQSQRSCRIWKS